VGYFGPTSALARGNSAQRQPKTVLALRGRHEALQCAVVRSHVVKMCGLPVVEPHSLPSDSVAFSTLPGLNQHPP